AGKLLGYPVERWLMEPEFWEHRLHPQDRDRVVAARAQALAQGKDHVLEYRLVDHVRRPIWVRDSVTVSAAAGGQLRLHGLLINITELKEMEGALRDSNVQLELRVQQRTAALANACVELHEEIRERKRLEKELLALTDIGRHQQGVDVHGDVGQSLA